MLRLLGLNRNGFNHYLLVDNSDPSSLLASGQLNFGDSVFFLDGDIKPLAVQFCLKCHQKYFAPLNSYGVSGLCPDCIEYIESDYYL